MDGQGINPRYLSKFIQSVYIADGLEEDTEELIKRCLQSDVLSFHVFCNIWKDMNFSAMYQGRQSTCELAELSEEAILIAKRYMTRVCDNFEESVAGLFLVYAILRLQPFKRFAPLRITPEDLEATTYLEHTARKHKRYDVLYILGSLLIEGPCEFHLAARDYGLESNIRKHFDASSSVNKVGVRPRGVFNHKNEELDLLRELSSLSKKYVNFKNKISANGDEKMVADMNYYKETVITELSTSLRNLINGDVDLLTTAKKHAQTQMLAELSTRQKIKQQAMKNTVKSMNHLTGLQERSNKTSPKKTKEPSPKKSDIKSSSKNRTGSPKKPIATPAQKKNKPSTSTSNRKTRIKSKVIDSSDDDSSSDVDQLVIYDDSDLDVSTEKESDDDDVMETIQTPPKEKNEPEITTRRRTAPLSMDKIQTETDQRKNKKNVIGTVNSRKSKVSKINKAKKRILVDGNSSSKGKEVLNKNSKIKTNKKQIKSPSKHNDTSPKKVNTVERNKLIDQLKTYASKKQKICLKSKYNPQEPSANENTGQNLIDTNSASPNIETSQIDQLKTYASKKKIICLKSKYNPQEPSAIENTGQNVIDTNSASVRNGD